MERSLSDNSVQAYIRDVVKLEQCLKLKNKIIPPAAVTIKDLKDFLKYLNELGLSAYSQARIISGLRGFFNYLLGEDLISSDPAELLEGPRLGRKLPDTLDYHEIEKILSVIDLSTPEGARNRAMLEILYSSGLRVSELVNLKRAGIYADIGFLRVIGKGNKERLVPIGKEALKYLQIYLNDIRPAQKIQDGFDIYVFLNRRGNRSAE
jgi:integrase/recombinase XerD